MSVIKADLRINYESASASYKALTSFACSRSRIAPKSNCIARGTTGDRFLEPPSIYSEPHFTSARAGLTLIPTVSGKAGPTAGTVLLTRTDSEGNPLIGAIIFYSSRGIPSISSIHPAAPLAFQARRHICLDLNGSFRSSSILYWEGHLRYSKISAIFIVIP